MKEVLGTSFLWLGRRTDRLCRWYRRICDISRSSLVEVRIWSKAPGSILFYRNRRNFYEMKLDIDSSPRMRIDRYLRVGRSNHMLGDGFDNRGDFCRGLGYHDKKANEGQTVVHHYFFHVSSNDIILDVWQSIESAWRNAENLSLVTWTESGSGIDAGFLLTAQGMGGNWEEAGRFFVWAMRIACLAHGLLPRGEE